MTHAITVHQCHVIVSIKTVVRWLQGNDGKAAFAIFYLKSNPEVVQHQMEDKNTMHYATGPSHNCGWS